MSQQPASHVATGTSAVRLSSESLSGRICMSALIQKPSGTKLLTSREQSLHSQSLAQNGIRRPRYQSGNLGGHINSKQGRGFFCGASEGWTFICLLPIHDFLGQMANQSITSVLTHLLPPQPGWKWGSSQICFTQPIQKTMGVTQSPMGE